FVEGRTKIDVPDWWAQAISKGQLTFQNRFSFVPNEEYYHDVGLTLKGPPGVSVREEHGKSILQIEKGTVDITTPIAETKGLADSFSAVARNQQCYVALHRNRASPFSIIGTEFPSGKILWRAKVWAGGGLVNYSGVGFHWVNMVIGDGRLVVFGIADDCAY